MKSWMEENHIEESKLVFRNVLVNKDRQENVFDLKKINQMTSELRKTGVYLAGPVMLRKQIKKDGNKYEICFPLMLPLS